MPCGFSDSLLGVDTLWFQCWVGTQMTHVQTSSSKHASDDTLPYLRMRLRLRLRLFVFSFSFPPMNGLDEWFWYPLLLSVCAFICTRFALMLQDQNKRLMVELSQLRQLNRSLSSAARQGQAAGFFVSLEQRLQDGQLGASWSNSCTLLWPLHHTALLAMPTHMPLRHLARLSALAPTCTYATNLACCD